MTKKILKLCCIAILCIGLAISILAKYNFQNSKKSKDNTPVEDTIPITDENSEKESSSSSEQNEDDDDEISEEISASEVPEQVDHNELSSEVTSSENNNQGNSNTTQNSNNSQIQSNNSQNTQTSNSQTAPSQPELPACASKKFVWSWFRVDFETSEACNKTGDQYVNNYQYHCTYLTDECGVTYYMLQLYDNSGREYYYKDVKTDAQIKEEKEKKNENE